MGYAFEGRCYPDTASALQAFKLAMPQSDGAGLLYFNTDPTITSAGVITYSMYHRPWTATTVGSRTGTMTLKSCTDAGFGNVDVPLMGFIVALFFAWAVGFRVGGGLVR